MPHETCEAGTPHQAHSRKWKSIGRVLLFPSLSVASTTACRCVRLVQKMAPKIPSPDLIMEEFVTVVSSEEVSLDVSVTEKYSREEALAGSSPNLSMLHYDNTSETMADRNLSLPKSTSGSRRRSAVWKHFYLSPLDSSKAVCVHCMNEFSRGKNGKDLGTSCLIRHMWKAHCSIVLQENGGNTGIPPLYPMPPSLLPALLPTEGDLNSASLSPGKQVRVPFCLLIPRQAS